MKSSKINYLIVGSFVVSSVVALVVAIALLSGRTGATERYYAVYGNVTGIKFGTQVLYEGFGVGQVKSIVPLEKDGRMRFRVNMDIQEGWKIPEDSVAEIAVSGLLSAVTVNIIAGTAKQAIKPGSQITSSEQANIFAVISSVAGDMRDLAQNNLKPLLATINKTAGSLGNLLENDGQVMFRELTNLAKDMAERAPKIVGNIESLTENLKATGDRLGAIMSTDNSKKLEKMIASMEAAAGNFAALSKDLGTTRKTVDKFLNSANGLVQDNRQDLERSVNDLRHVMDSMARHIDSVNQNMDGAARNMYEFSRQIRQNPGLLLGGTPPQDAATNR